MKLIELDDFKLVNLYGELLKELKNREIIRTNNIVGEIGEYLTIDYYSKTRGLPRLAKAPISTKSIDAISDKGERYAIKTTTGNTTGVFYGLPPKGDNMQPKQTFEYVAIVILDGNYDLQEIIELSWQQFLTNKKWHSTMKAWNITVTKKLRAEGKIVFCKSSSTDI